MKTVTKNFNFRATLDPNDPTGKAKIPAAEPLKELKLTLMEKQDIINLINGMKPNKTILSVEEQAKVDELIVDSINSVAIDYVKNLFDDIGLEKVRVEGIDPELYDFSLIAMLPPSTRGATGIDDDTWDDFEQDYVSVMTQHGIEEKRAQVGASILKNKLVKVRQSIDALKQFEQRIQMWYGHTSKGETLAAVYTYLNARVQKFIVANEPQQVLASF